MPLLSSVTEIPINFPFENNISKINSVNENNLQNNNITLNNIAETFVNKSHLTIIMNCKPVKLM